MRKSNAIRPEGGYNLTGQTGPARSGVGAKSVREADEAVYTKGEFAAMRQVLIIPGEDGQWVAECPSLPGCISQGRTRPEAIANIKEAIEAYVQALRADALPVPEEKFEAMLLAV